MPSVARSASAIRSSTCDRGGLAEQQALGLDRQHDRDRDEQQPDQRGADHVEPQVVREQREPDAEEREDQTDERGEVLEQDHGQLRLPWPAG